MKREPKPAFGWAEIDAKTGKILTVHNVRPTDEFFVGEKPTRVVTIGSAKHRHHTRLEELCKKLVPRYKRKQVGFALGSVIEQIAAELERQKEK